MKTVQHKKKVSKVMSELKNKTVQHEVKVSKPKSASKKKSVLRKMKVKPCDFKINPVIYPYEQKRLDNIKEQKELLVKLGFSKPESEKKAVPRKKKVSKISPNLPVRRSSRLKQMP
jgi:hypothetical protein